MSKVLALIVGFAIGTSASFIYRRATASRLTQQATNAKPRERPVTFEATKENEGKRCKAAYYFGRRFQAGSEEGFTPFCYKLQQKLIEAARTGNLTDIRDALKFGASLKLPVDNSFPALLTAASSGHADAARLLMDNGAEVNQISDFQNTPLNVAASQGHLEVIQVLLERGADVCHKSSGNTAADIAESRGFKEIAALLKTSEAVKCK